MNVALIVIVVVAFAVVAWSPVSRRLQRGAAHKREVPVPAFAPPVHDREAPIAWTSEGAPSPKGASAPLRDRPVSLP